MYKILTISAIILLVIAGLFADWMIAYPNYARAWLTLLATITTIFSVNLWYDILNS